MNGWMTCHYRFRESQEARWEAASIDFPAPLVAEIDFDFGRCWIVDLPISAVFVAMSFGHEVEALSETRFLVSDEAREPIANLLREHCHVRGRWWSIRRAHFASQRAKDALERLM